MKRWQEMNMRERGQRIQELEAREHKIEEREKSVEKWEKIFSEKYDKVDQREKELNYKMSYFELGIENMKQAIKKYEMAKVIKEGVDINEDK